MPPDTPPQFIFVNILTASQSFQILDFILNNKTVTMFSLFTIMCRSHFQNNSQVKESFFNIKLSALSIFSRRFGFTNSAWLDSSQISATGLKNLTSRFSRGFRWPSTREMCAWADFINSKNKLLNSVIYYRWICLLSSSFR